MGRGLQELAGQSARHVQRLAILANLGTGRLPHVDHFLIVTDGNADFFHDRLGIVLDNLEAFLGQDLG